MSKYVCDDCGACAASDDDFGEHCTECSTGIFDLELTLDVYRKMQLAFEKVSEAADILRHLDAEQKVEDVVLAKKLKGQLQSTRNLRHALYAMASRAEELADE